MATNMTYIAQIIDSPAVYKANSVSSQSYTPQDIRSV